MAWSELPQYHPIPVMTFTVLDDMSVVAEEAAQKMHAFMLTLMGIAKVGGTYIYCADCPRKIKKTGDGYARFRRHRSRSHRYGS